MPNTKCCLCPKRIATNHKRTRVNQLKFKDQFLDFVDLTNRNSSSGGSSFNFSSDVVCQKCHAKVINYSKRKVPNPYADSIYDAHDSTTVDMETEVTTVFEKDQTEDFLTQDNQFHTNNIEDDQGSDYPQFENNTDDDFLEQAEAEVQNNSAEIMNHDHADAIEKSDHDSETNLDQVVEVGQVRLHLDSIPSTQKKCCICGSTRGRKRISNEAIQQVWIQRNIYIPKGNRSCEQHLEGKVFKQLALKAIASQKQYVAITEIELSRWILELTRCALHKTFLNFDDPANVTAADYEFLVGFGKQQFEDILQTLEAEIKNSKRRSKRNALALFLMFLRHNMTQGMLGKLFNIPQQSTVSYIISSITAALDKSFVPKYLGLDHMTRQEAIENHSRILFNELFEAPQNTLFLVMDGTYLYIEKPINFEIQKKSYSGQKKRNLIKPFMIILPSGYIVDAVGPFYADGRNNDASILKSLLKVNSPLRKLLLPQDHVVVDRGFRDVIDDLEALNFNVHMPNLKTAEKQFSTAEANQSRMVTMIRWTVEAANGRIKQKFKFFKSNISGGYLEKAGTLFKIACSLINAFCGPLSQDEMEKHQEYSSRALELLNLPNEMQSEVEERKLDRRTKAWKRASAETLQGFPRLSIKDVEYLSMGTYQLKLSKQYTALHLNDDGYTILLNDEEPNVVRVRLESRFTSKTHELWIKFLDGINTLDGIVGYYCRCMQGGRTIGSCAHIISVIRYLAYDRHQEAPASKRRRTVDKLNILDAATDQ